MNKMKYGKYVKDLRVINVNSFDEFKLLVQKILLLNNRNFEGLKIGFGLDKISTEIKDGKSFRCGKIWKSH